MSAYFLFFSVDMPFLYYSSMKGNSCEESSSLMEDNLGHLGFVAISPMMLASSWCATWLAVIRQCEFSAVGSLEIFLIILQAFRVLPVLSFDVIISSHLLLLSASILLISSYLHAIKRVARVLLLYAS